MRISGFPLLALLGITSLPMAALMLSEPSDLPYMFIWMPGIIGWFIGAVIGSLFLSAFIGCGIGEYKGCKGVGTVLGFFFGPLGWILTLFEVGWGAVRLLLILELVCGFWVYRKAKPFINEGLQGIRAEMKPSVTKPAEPDSTPTTPPPVSRVSVPAPTPQIIPLIQSLRGYVIRNAVVQRQDSDGFILASPSGTAKVFNAELAPDTVQRLRAAAPNH